jgi:hypothetical protein
LIHAGRPVERGRAWGWLVLGIGVVIAITTPRHVRAGWYMTLTIQGGSDKGATTVLSEVTSGRGGEIELFGTVNTLTGKQPPGRGARFRIDTPKRAGSNFVLTMVARVAFTDGPRCNRAETPLRSHKLFELGSAHADCVPPGQRARIDIAQAGGSFPVGRARFALGTREDWTQDNAGQSIAPQRTFLSTAAQGESAGPVRE